MKWIIRLTGFFLVVCLFGMVGWWSYHFPQAELVSPVLGVSKIRYADNIWTPQEATSSSLTNAPEITAQAAFFVEAKTGRILYAKNPKEHLGIASLTKIMTVIVALENKSYGDVFSVSQKASEAEPDEMILQPGEKLTMEELLSGIFLVSANDAAEVLAEGVTGNRSEFIHTMNLQAKFLGMNDTIFINPTGLEEDKEGSDPSLGSTSLGSDPQPAVRKEQYSSAYDVALMSRYLVATWPKIVDITSSPHIFLPKTETHQDYDMYSGINLLTTYPGVVGLKTGYTPEAGLTLVTLAKRGDSEVLGVLLNSISRRDDAKVLLDYSFQKLGF